MRYNCLLCITIGTAPHIKAEMNLDHNLMKFGCDLHSHILIEGYDPTSDSITITRYSLRNGCVIGFLTNWSAGGHTMIQQ